MLSTAFPGRHSGPTVTNARFTRRPGWLRLHRCDQHHEAHKVPGAASPSHSSCNWRAMPPQKAKPCAESRFPKSKPLD